jgi:hypothetical protein
METLQHWVGAGSTVETVYWLIALVSSGFFALRILTAFVGLELDVEFDLDVGVGDVSLGAIAALLAMSGWTGVMFYHTTPLAGVTILGISVAAGLVSFFATIFLFTKMKGLESQGNLDVKNSIGQIATVYLGIPADGEGEGQIQLTVQGKMVILEALTEGDAISTGEKVLVFGQNEHGKLLVTPYEGE